MTAIPVAAIRLVERVHFDLPMSKKEKEKQGVYIDNLFEIHLKDDFIDIYLRPGYEHRISHCSHASPEKSPPHN